MSRKSILEAKQKAKETNELLEYLTDLIEKNDKRYSFVFGAGGAGKATMEIFDNKNQAGYVLKLERLEYDKDGKPINLQER